MKDRRTTDSTDSLYEDGYGSGDGKHTNLDGIKTIKLDHNTDSFKTNHTPKA